MNSFYTLTLKETTTMHLRHAQPHQIQLSVPHTPYPRKQQIKRLNNSFPAPTAHHHRQQATTSDNMYIRGAQPKLFLGLNDGSFKYFSATTSTQNSRTPDTFPHS